MIPDGEATELIIRVGQNIKKLREERKIPGRIIAEKAGFAVQNLYRIECGRGAMRLSTLEIIAEALGVHPAHLLLENPSKLKPRKKRAKAT